jgi:hypothetical protein
MDVILDAHESTSNTSGSVPRAAPPSVSIAHEAAAQSVLHEKV